MLYMSVIYGEQIIKKKLKEIFSLILGKEMAIMQLQNDPRFGQSVKLFKFWRPANNI